MNIVIGSIFFLLTKKTLALTLPVTTLVQTPTRLGDTRSAQKIRGLFELRGSSWFQENPLGVARFVQIG